MYVSNEKKESIIGNEAQQKFGILDINYPIQEGKIINWDEMTKFGFIHSSQNYKSPQKNIIFF